MNTPTGETETVPTLVIRRPGGGSATNRLHHKERSSRPGVLHKILSTMRPRQWIKNLLVFVAPAAAGVLSHRLEFLRSLAAFGIYCAVASGVYLINDSIDAEADRHHPDKKTRPIASGDLKRPLAIAAGAMLLILGLVAAWFVARLPLVLVMGIYVLISIVYAIRLKREPVIELAAVASGFVLRGIAGGVATHIPLSSWFLAVASFGALFVVIGKRASEHRRLGEPRGQHRKVLAVYTASFLRSALILTATATVTAYCLWAYDRGGLQSHAVHHFVWIQLSVMPIILGTLHVLRLVDAGLIEAPENLAFRDHLLQVLCATWVLMFSIGIYG